MVQTGRESHRLGILREGNGIVIVLDGYSATDLASQLEKFRDELLYADLEIVTNRIDRLHAQLKKNRPTKEKEIDQAELEVLARIQSKFEAGEPLVTLSLKPEEEKAIRSLQLLTLKPEMVFVNQGDASSESFPAALLAMTPNPVAAPV